MSRLLEIYERCKKAAEEAGDEPFSLWSITDETYRFWRAHAGNAKARRRWRRRNVPNTQRTVAGYEQWVRTRVAKSEHFGDWNNGSIWAPGIWAGLVPVASTGATGAPTMRVAKVDREARTITMETLP